MGQGVGPVQGQQLLVQGQPQPVQPAQHPGLAAYGRNVVVPHQRFHLPGRFPAEPQAAANGGGHFRPFGLVAVKVAAACAVHGKAGGLPHVVKQRRQPQHRVRPGIFQGVEDVLPHVEAVVGAFLIQPGHGGQLRQKFLRNRPVFPQHLRGVFSAEKPQKFFPHPLCGKRPQKPFFLQHGLRRALLQAEPQHGGEAQPPQDAQAVLLQTLLRVAHTANQPGGQVGPAAEGVCQAAVPGHGVYGKVPAGQILPQAAGKGHALGPAVVLVLAVQPEGGNFHRQAGEADRHRAMLFPRPAQRQAGKDGGRLPRQGRGGNVPVMGLRAEQAVTHAAAHQVRLKPGAVQGVQRLPRLGGNRESHAVSLLALFKWQGFPLGPCGGTI